MSKLKCELSDAKAALKSKACDQTNAIALAGSEAKLEMTEKVHQAFKEGMQQAHQQQQMMQQQMTNTPGGGGYHLPFHQSPHYSHGGGSPAFGSASGSGPSPQSHNDSMPPPPPDYSQYPDSNSSNWRRG